MASRMSALTFSKANPGPGNVCNFCYLTLAFYGNPNDPAFRLPCGCVLDLSCICFTLKQQLVSLSFFNCPGCYADLNSAGPRARALRPPTGEILQVQPIGETIQVVTFIDDDIEDITGHLVYRQVYDRAAGTLTVMINIVPENDGPGLRG